MAELSKTEDPSNGVVATLESICRLYGLWSIEESAQYFLKFGFYSADEMDKVSEDVSVVCHVTLRDADADVGFDHLVRSISFALN